MSCNPMRLAKLHKTGCRGRSAGLHALAIERRRSRASAGAGRMEEQGLHHAQKRPSSYRKGFAVSGTGTPDVLR
jgi:hypothetical protein